MDETMVIRIVTLWNKPVDREWVSLLEEFANLYASKQEDESIKMTLVTSSGRPMYARLTLMKGDLAIGSDRICLARRNGINDQWTNKLNYKLELIRNEKGIQS